MAFWNKLFGKKEKENLEELEEVLEEQETAIEESIEKDSSENRKSKRGFLLPYTKNCFKLGKGCFPK